MISFDQLEILANWTGWLPISVFLLLVIGLVVYFSNEKIKIIKLKIETIEAQNSSLREKLLDQKNCSPDVLARRYLDEIEYMKEGILLISRDKDEMDQQILSLKKDLLEKIEEAQNFRAQLEEAQGSLNELGDIPPREGKVDQKIFSFLLSEIDINSALYIAVEFIQPSLDMNSFKQPFKLFRDYPGMFKTVLWIEDYAGKQIGFVDNRFTSFYDRDYFDTLIHILELNTDNEFIPEDGSGKPLSIILSHAEISGSSSYIDNLIFIKIPFDPNNVSAKGIIIG